MNIGETPRLSDKGIVTSLAWGMNHRVSYVFEGNLNYTGAVISWLKNDVGLIGREERQMLRHTYFGQRVIFGPGYHLSRLFIEMQKVLTGWKNCKGCAYCKCPEG